ncbi:SDR family oxidoreductase, partial [Oceanithermus profundus]
MFEGAGVLVTGAARGIGRAIAEAFAREGARLALVDVDPAGEAVARELGATFVQADLAGEAARERAFARAREALGEVSVLVNNAAISAPGSALTVRLDDWRRVLEVNLTAPMHLSALFARALPRG